MRNGKLNKAITTPDLISPTIIATAFQTYNRLAEKMNCFHDALRSTWNELYAGATSITKHPSPHRLVSLGLHFCNHLKGNLDIEEMIWYPVLAEKVTSFRPGHFAMDQYRQVHKGLDVLESYLGNVQAGSKRYSDINSERL
ncbi:hypothetical protein BBP40_004231 [Aspergillus hancockii]|nr:hypothetical protein BBP40_004231 [Aspergillus hancockii]